MNFLVSSPTSFKQYLIVCLWLLMLVWPTQAQAVKSPIRMGTPEQRAARYFESIRRAPPQMLAFLLRMPKGGDLHNHLSGGIYAETFVQWAAQKNLCVNQATGALTPPPCDPDKGLPPVSKALTDGVLYRQLIDAWVNALLAAGAVVGAERARPFL